MIPFFCSATRTPEKAAKTGISLESRHSSLHPYHHLAESASSISTDLARADRASVILQHPNLTIVLDFVFMDTVSCAVLAMGTSTVIPTIQVKANSVIGTAMPSSSTFINVCKNMPCNAFRPRSINKNVLAAVNINDSWPLKLQLKINFHFTRTGRNNLQVHKKYFSCHINF